MILPIVGIVIIFILYFLLVKGLLWKLILGVGGVFGIHIFLEEYFPSTQAQVFQDNSVDWIHWSIAIPCVLFILALATTKE